MYGILFPVIIFKSVKHSYLEDLFLSVCGCTVEGILLLFRET